MPVSPIRKSQPEAAPIVWVQFRKLTEAVLLVAQDDAKEAFTQLGQPEAPDKFLYASEVVGACQRILASSPEEIDGDELDKVFRAVTAFIS